MFDIVGMLEAGFKAATPIIADHEAQKYENEKHGFIAEFEEAFAESDNGIRASKLNDVVTRLCQAAGHPAGDIRGASIEIPVQHFRAFISIIIDDIYQSRRAATLQSKLGI